MEREREREREGGGGGVGVGRMYTDTHRDPLWEVDQSQEKVCTRTSRFMLING